MANSEEEKSFDGGGDWAEETSDGIAVDDPVSSGRQKNYKILNEEDIKRLLEDDISVSGVLSVPRGVATALLCQNNWIVSSVYDAWFAAAVAAENPPAPQGSTKETCKICYGEFRPKRTVSAACGHLFCSRCLRTYIRTAINGGAACLTLRCPEPGCKAAVTSDMVEKLASAAKIAKYRQYLRQSYVESSRNKKWCPAPGCGRVVELDSAESETYDIACDCSHKFCWRCMEERHRPLSCKMVAEWAEKNRSEAENATWIVAYTKPCPKCGRPIEKDRGCNHMTCGPPCRFEFCWICCQRWRGHGADFYSCNRYMKEEEAKEGERSRVDARRLLERYSHYYKRFDMNDKSRKVAMADLERARERCLGQGEVADPGKMQFVVEAWKQIVECRLVLKWSYAYGYYLEGAGKKALFEYLQGEAEAALERLHHFAEMEIEDEGVYVDIERFKEFRVKLVDLTRVTSKYFENLVVALENDLVEVGSSRRKKRGRSSEKATSQSLRVRRTTTTTTTTTSRSLRVRRTATTTTRRRILNAT